MHPAGRFNRVIWRGLMGRKPYPALSAAPQTGRHVAVNRDDD